MGRLLGIKGANWEELGGTGSVYWDYLQLCTHKGTPPGPPHNAAMGWWGWGAIMTPQRDPVTCGDIRDPKTTPMSP